MRFRPLASLPVLCTLGGLLAGCGAKQASTPSSAVTARVSSGRPAHANQRPTRARALAFARAVNLTPADIPEATISHSKERASAPGERRELDRCEGRHAPGRKLAARDSPKLTRGAQLETEQIRSYVAVASSGRTAERGLAPLASRSVRECVARVLSRQFARQNVRGAHWGRASALPLSMPAPGADAAAGIRVGAALSIEYNEVSVPLYVDVVAFALGPAEVVMSAVSITQPVPAATERQLFALLLARAEAHPL